MAKVRSHSMYAKFGDLAHRQIGGRKVPVEIADTPTILEVGGSRPLADMNEIDLPENVSIEMGNAPKIRLRPGEDEATIRISMQDLEPVENASLQIDQERLAGEVLRANLFEAARRRALAIAKVTGPRFRALEIGFIPGHEVDLPALSAPTVALPKTTVQAPKTPPTPNIPTPTPTSPAPIRKTRRKI
ncbi:hypothetical protein [Roseomonas genomospecies 6]|uniref:Uncharacterized protein n=1 Tax=Roseomonas genomospecies 6 TaxID=214106 RepID=A0A9W7KQC8_9PROT|nr:hypothetical protein [Roseomonas genomospecies 6]KAA0677611.1 hypothetical protein DS843_22490 [Roseomonas genomospecies 6]